MTNAQIIFQEKMRLAEEGILKYTGRTVIGLNMAGEEVELPEVQPIHTYQAWQSLGYQVKKGEKAVAKFAVWKFLNRKKKADDDAEEDGDKAVVGGKCYMKVAAFFTDEQVEKKEA